MDWIDVLPPWGLVAIALVGLALVAAVIVALLLRKQRIKEIEVSVPPILKVTTEPQEKDDQSPPQPQSHPRQSRTRQKAEATDGAKAKVKQSAPKGTPSTQEATADGQGTELDVEQSISD